MFELTPEEYKQSLRDQLDDLPDQPGVYLHKNADGDVIYVGKAVSLKNRVRSYFQSPKNHPAKLRALVKHIARFDYILTDNEMEALTLESNLIKQYRPYYNILLKDDKTFPYVRINRKQKFPRADIVNVLKKDGADYFGPYLSRTAVREAMDAVRENFPIRTCKKDIDKMIARGERPCLNYHIGKCVAPCTGNVSREEYHVYIDEVVTFLRGDTEGVLARLRLDMARASDAMEYEKATQIRDHIRAIETISEKQKAITANTDEKDIFAFAKSGNDALIYALFMRDGRIIGAEKYDMIAPEEAPEDIMASFLTQFYSAAKPCKGVIVSHLPTDAEQITEWLSEQIEGRAKVQVICPQKGKRKELVDLAKSNAEEYLEKMASGKRREWERTEGALRDLSIALDLDALPERIECFDISHTSGTDPVASMVVFENGKPAKKEYRRFKIRTAGNDDYASMREVLTRRFKRGIEERAEGKKDGFAHLPDLLVIDGGKGQLSVGLDALHELTLYEGQDLDVIGLAERLEEVFLPGRERSILIETGTPALHLLQRIRDEAHRFAITFHRSLRQKTALFSLLDEIPGIGPRRKKALFDTFVSFDAIKNAAEEELAAAPGMSAPSAAAVFAYFHPKTEMEEPNNTLQEETKK